MHNILIKKQEAFYVKSIQSVSESQTNSYYLPGMPWSCNIMDLHRVDYLYFKHAISYSITILERRLDDFFPAGHSYDIGFNYFPGGITESIYSSNPLIFEPFNSSNSNFAVLFLSSIEKYI